ncbi:MAG: hypothetical protein DI537_05295 [Stutzerimonas stutzeri]|nr:MAG: hypothetical protein DI537_05295 [Stutzerimonas stutzeri]
MLALFFFGFSMIHNDANIEKLADRLVLILRERAASAEKPDEFSIVAAPLIQDTKPRAAERFGIENPREIKGLFSDTMATLVAAKISKPSVIKSIPDKFVQDGRDRGVINALERHKIALHKAEMRKEGHTRASATPGIAAGSSDGAFA